MQSYREYTKDNGTVYVHIIYKKHMYITLTHGWESYRQWPQRYDKRTTVPKQKSRPDSLWLIHDTPHQSFSVWRYIRQPKKTQINKYVTRENTTRIDHDYIVGDKILIKNKSAYKYKNLFRGQYEIVQTWTNVTVALQMGAVTHSINIHNNKTHNDADL